MSTETDINNGERCRQCRAWIFHIYPPGHSMLCVECGQLELEGECSHRSRLRCPQCMHSWDVWEGDDSGIFEDGSFEVSCPSCDHDFEITTSVSYVFTSPKAGETEDDD